MKSVVIILFTRHLYVYQVKVDGPDIQHIYEFWSEILKVRNLFGDRDVDERIILK
jgi:hypothetical protein